MSAVQGQNIPAFRVCRLIGRVRSELVGRIEQELHDKGFRLSFSQFAALKLIESGQAVTPGALARALHHNAGAMTRLLDRLEQLGFIRRRRDPDDRRALQVELTAEGRKTWRRINSCGERVAARAMAGSSAMERAALHDALARMLANLKPAG